MKIKTEIINKIESYEFDDLVEKTYGRPYTYQQQDGCRSRGYLTFVVPESNPYDFENDTIPEIINGEDMGVSFKAWLERDPKQKLESRDEDWAIHLWWTRNFYPSFDMVVNDLHKKGLIDAGKYAMIIDW